MFSISLNSNETRLILYIFKSPGSMPPHSPNKCMFGIEKENFWNVLLQNVIKIYSKTHSIAQVSIRGRMSPNPYQVHGHDIYFTIKKKIMLKICQ